MAETEERPAAELVAEGRRHLAVREYGAAADALALACRRLAEEHGDAADACAEPYLWYGKSLLGLSREESGVLGERVPGAAADAEGEASVDGADEPRALNGARAASPAAAREPRADCSTEEADSAGGDRAADEAADEPQGEDEDADDDDEDVDNLQLAWETLEVARTLLARRAAGGGADATAARALLADALLSLGQVALESDTFDKALDDMRSALDILRELHGADDRRVAETHYHIGVAHSLAGDFAAAAEHFSSAEEALAARVAALDAAGGDGAEARELRALLPELRDKVRDARDARDQSVKSIRDALAGSIAAAVAAPAGEGPASGAPSAASGAPAADISHLIKRKRKASADAPSAAKKAAL